MCVVFFLLSILTANTVTVDGRRRTPAEIQPTSTWLRRRHCARSRGHLQVSFAAKAPGTYALLMHYAPRSNASQVETLSLAGNNLNGHHLTYLDKYLPRIVNLSLQNNNMRMWKDLDTISARREKLLHLRELVLMGNPIREQEYLNGTSERYKRYVQPSSRERRLSFPSNLAK